MMRPQIPGMRRREAQRRLLEAPRFEIVPLPDALERARDLPAGATVTVTASPRRGVEATVALAEELAARGYDAVPHLAARQLLDEAQLAEILGRLREVGVRDLFVVGGDAAEAGGAFPDGLALLKAIDVSGYRFDRIGVPSYPEGHPHIDDEALWVALAGKRPYATYTVTQMCFDPRAVLRFATAARDRGIDLPIIAGVPGATTVSKLLKMSARVGVGDSVRFLRGNRSAARRLLNPRGYRPDRLVRGLAEQSDDGLAASAGRGTGDAPAAGVSGVHIYTFNEIAATVQWLHRARGTATTTTTPAPAGTRGGST